MPVFPPSSESESEEEKSEENAKSKMDINAPKTVNQEKNKISTNENQEAHCSKSDKEKS
jgi:hypothetical protein